MIDETEIAPDAPVEDAPPPAEEPSDAPPPAPDPLAAALSTRTDWMLAHLSAIDRGAALPTPDEIALIQDPTAQRLVAAAIAERERQQAALAEERARIQAAQQEVEARHRATLAQQQEALRYAADPQLAAWLEQQGQQPEKVPDYDDPAYPAYAAKQAAVEMLRGFVGQLQTQRQAYEQEYAAKEAQAAYEARAREVQAYIDQFPEDFADVELRQQVKTLHQQHGLSIPEAHQHVVALRLLQDREFAEAAREARAAAQARVNRGGRPLPTLTTQLKERASAEERAAWGDRNPEAVQERFKRYMEEGVGYGRS